MPIATTLPGLMAKISTSPEVLVIGLAAGYIIKWFQDRQKGGGMAGGGWA